MNSFSLKENMKRFGTKNLSEQEEVPVAEPTQAPAAGQQEKVMAKKIYSFKGSEYKDKEGFDVKNSPYSIEIELVSSPDVDKAGKVTGSTKKVMADGKIILAVTTAGNVYQAFPNNFPKPLKGQGAGRIMQYILGMLQMELNAGIKNNLQSVQKLVPNLNIGNTNDGFRPASLYKGEDTSEYYTIS